MKNKREREMRTEIFDGGVDGVAAVEEETDQPRSDVATASGDANHLSFSLRSNHYPAIPTTVSEANFRSVVCSL